MNFAFPPAPPVNLPIAGTKKSFPVRRIYCVGKNYADHVVEMGGTVERSEPIFFTKAAETLVHSGNEIPFPPHTQNLHFEVELVVAMGPKGIFGYGVGIDLTRRDIQAKAKAQGGPWARAKNFHYSAPCSTLTRAEDVDISSAHIEVVGATAIDVFYLRCIGMNDQRKKMLRAGLLDILRDPEIKTKAA